jgi:hypothetical protein
MCVLGTVEVGDPFAALRSACQFCPGNHDFCLDVVRLRRGPNLQLRVCETGAMKSGVGRGLAVLWT